MLSVFFYNGVSDKAGGLAKRNGKKPDLTRKGLRKLVYIFPAS